MRIHGTIWLREVVDKLLVKHGVTTGEVEEALARASGFRRLERGTVRGEDLYVAFGRSHSGRYLTVFFIFKSSGDALIVSARDSTKRERRNHGR